MNDKEKKKVKLREAAKTFNETNEHAIAGLVVAEVIGSRLVVKKLEKLENAQ